MVNRKVLRICLVLAFIVTLCFSVFAEEFDISQFDMQKYEWYKEGDKWRCKKYGHDLVDVTEEINLEDWCEFDADGYEHGKYNMYFPSIKNYVWYKDEKGLKCKYKGEDLINIKKWIGLRGYYSFDEDGYAKTGVAGNILYDKDLTTINDEYIYLNGKEYYTDYMGILIPIRHESDKPKKLPKFYLDLDASNRDIDKARQLRDEEAANEAAFLAFVDENTEKKTELIFESYKLGEIIENADGTITDIKTGDLIRNKAISYEWTEYVGYLGKDMVYTTSIVLDENGHRVSGYYAYGGNIYKFSTKDKHNYIGKIKDEKEKANALAEIEAKKNGYSIVSANSSNNKPVFSEVEVPVAQDKSVVSEIEAPVAHTD